MEASFQSAHKKHSIGIHVWCTEKPKQSEVIFSARSSLKGRESSGAGNGVANAVCHVRLSLLSLSCAMQALPPGTAFQEDHRLQACAFPDWLSFWPQGEAQGPACSAGAFWMLWRWQSHGRKHQHHPKHGYLFYLGKMGVITGSLLFLKTKKLVFNIWSWFGHQDMDFALN